ncbi:MAG: SinI family restriction endonuclease [Methylococcales bacterium]|nr:SinI family restriction endonuclease [Methylococcales bacterium]
MTFIKNADEIARQAILAIDPSLENKFVDLIRFLSLYPAMASALGGKNSSKIGSENYILAAASNYATGRKPKRPKPPATIPDEMVSFVLEHYFDVKASDLERVKKQHALSMGAENIVGNLLEHYLSSVLELHGWVWCAGSLVKAVDFVRPPTNRTDWVLLQVKNRDNSENSSSSAIRIGTTIDKWHRTFWKKPGSNWATFPDAIAREHLSEEGFRAFVKTYLENLR